MFYDRNCYMCKYLAYFDLADCGYYCTITGRKFLFNENDSVCKLYYAENEE